MHGSVLGKSGGPLAKSPSQQGGAVSRTDFVGVRGANVQLPLGNSIISLKKNPKNQTTNEWEGLSWPDQKLCRMGWVISLPRFWHTRGLWSMQAPSSILLTAWVSAPLWLCGSFFSFVILTGQFYDIFSSAGFARQRQHALIEPPALSFHKASPGYPPGLQSCLPTAQLVPPAFIRSRCLAGTPGDVHSTACTVERIPFLQGGWSLWSCMKALGCLCQPLAVVLGTRLPCPLLTLTTSREELIAASFNR